MALGYLRMGQVVMALIIILVELEQASLFAEASQLYSDLKFYFVLQICWVWVKGYPVWKKCFIYKNDQQAASAASQSLSDKHTVSVESPS